MIGTSRSDALYAPYYRQGWSDGEIAKQVGRSRSSVEGWRASRRLPANKSTGALSKDEHAQRRRLYDEGLSDAEIARREGRAQPTILKWRRRAGLPVNKPKPLIGITVIPSTLARYVGAADATWETWLEEMGATFSSPGQLARPVRGHNAW